MSPPSSHAKPPSQTKPPSQAKPPRQSKRWFFKLNNYSGEEYTTTVEWCRGNSRYSIVACDNGEDGKPNLQGYITGKKSWSSGALKNALGDRFDFTIENRSEGDIYNDCSKVGSFVESGKRSAQGRRSDLDGASNINKKAKSIPTASSNEDLNCLELSLPSECGKDRFRLIDEFKTGILEEINKNVVEMKWKKKFQPIQNTGGSLMQLKIEKNFFSLFGATNRNNEHNRLNDRFRKEVLSHVKKKLRDVKIDYDLVIATAIYTKNGVMKRQQPAHMDYSNERIFFSSETSRTGNNRKLREHEAIPWTGHMPITENGRYLFLWNGPGKVIPFLIPYGKMLLIRGDVVHAGGLPEGEHEGKEYDGLHLYLPNNSLDINQEIVSTKDHSGMELKNNYKF
jgi:hypothetical protein